MLTKYEEHLFESLVTVQELLRKTMDDNERLMTEVQKMKDDDNNWYRSWGREREKNIILEKQVAEFESLLAERKNEESDATASNPSDETNLKEVN